MKNKINKIVLTAGAAALGLATVAGSSVAITSCSVNKGSNLIPSMVVNTSKSTNGGAILVNAGDKIHFDLQVANGNLSDVKGLSLNDVQDARYNYLITNDYLSVYVDDVSFNHIVFTLEKDLNIPENPYFDGPFVNILFNVIIASFDGKNVKQFTTSDYNAFLIQNKSVQERNENNDKRNVVRTYDASFPAANLLAIANEFEAQDTTAYDFSSITDWTGSTQSMEVSALLMQYIDANKLLSLVMYDAMLVANQFSELSEEGISITTQVNKMHSEDVEAGEPCPIVFSLSQIITQSTNGQTTMLPFIPGIEEVFGLYSQSYASATLVSILEGSNVQQYHTGLLMMSNIVSTSLFSEGGTLAGEFPAIKAFGLDLKSILQVFYPNAIFSA